MRNGLKLTLSMVAFALTGMQATAMAPTISDIPSPIVGDEGAATGTAVFVFPDAFDIDSYVTDTDGPSAIVWSYDVSSTQIYSFNDADPLGSDDPLNPPAGKQITAAGQLDPADGDSDVGTVTIRNVHLSPIGGGGPGDTGLATGIVASETQLVTLYASDGATYSSTDVFVYTDNDGSDRLSGSGDVVYEPGTAGIIPGGASPWRYTSSLGSPTSSSSASTGLCISVPAAGLNNAEWFSNYDIISLVANSVYQARIEFTTNQATVGSVPLFSIIWDNSDPDDVFGAANIYSSELFVLDNLGGANAPSGAPNGIAAHYSVFAPSQMLTAQWNANGFTGANDPLNDMRLRFTMADYDGLGYGAESDSGQVCLQDIVVTRYDYNTLTPAAVSPAYNVTAMDADAAGGQTHSVSVLITGGTSSVTSTGGDLTILPPAAGWDLEIVEVRPGDTTNDPNTGGAQIVDNYPIAWLANTVYMATWELSAPNALSETNPPDVIRFGFDTPTQELIMTTQVTGSLNATATPKQIAGSVTAPQPYVAFFHSNAVTDSITSEHNRIRPRLDIICSPQLTYNGVAMNTGEIGRASWWGTVWK